MTDERERLPDRRGSDLVDFSYHGRKWTVGTSRFAAILLSIGLQFGAPLATVRHAIEARGGPLAAALAALDGAAP